MPETQQPKWKCVGHVGDVDPIAYGGGFVYEDTTGVYGPEIEWFDPAPDAEWEQTEGATPVGVYRILIEKNPADEWWYERLLEVAAACGQTVVDYQQRLAGSTMKRAYVYYDLVLHFGAFEFDQYPRTMTEDEAYEKYKTEIKLA
jgi:hypothetical protein